MKFNVLDDISFTNRTLLLLLWGATCCWGFANNAVLLVFASKIGFPLAVTVCALTNNFKRQVINLLYYTFLLISIGYIFFSWRSDLSIVPAVVSAFQPNIFDFLLAIGLGWTLANFWTHGIRINIIVASAALASLLPACIMAGYQLAHNDLLLALNSLYLYSEYVIGMAAGALIHTQMDKNT